MINVAVREKLCGSDKWCLTWDSAFSICKQALYPFEFFNGVLPLSRCIVPTLHMVNSEVDFGRCFLKYPYEKTVQLVNQDDLPGCYTVLPQVSYDILFQWWFFFFSIGFSWWERETLLKSHVPEHMTFCTSYFLTLRRSGHRVIKPQLDCHPHD